MDAYFKVPYVYGRWQNWILCYVKEIYFKMLNHSHLKSQLQ